MATTGKPVPGVRQREIAAVLGVTERRTFGIVTDLTEAGYVVKEKDGRRNRYDIQNHLPLPGLIDRAPTIGELMGLLVDTRATESARVPNQDGDPSDKTRVSATRPTSPAQPG